MMRIIAAAIVTALVLAPSTVSAQEQDGFSRLLARTLSENPMPMALSVEDAEVDTLLNEFARAIGKHKVVFAEGVGELAPITLELTNSDYETVVRLILDMASLRHTVVGDDTLLVSLQ